MTIITMDWRRLELKAKGHAKAGEHGKDLVCAAISALVQTLAQYLEDTNAAGDYRHESGDVAIRAAPGLLKRRRIRLAFRQTMTGLRVLANQYPGNVWIKEDR